MQKKEVWKSERVTTPIFFAQIPHYIDEFIYKNWPNFFLHSFSSIPTELGEPKKNRGGGSDELFFTIYRRLENEVSLWVLEFEHFQNSNFGLLFPIIFRCYFIVKIKIVIMARIFPLNNIIGDDSGNNNINASAPSASLSLI